MRYPMFFVVAIFVIACSQLGADAKTEVSAGAETREGAAAALSPERIAYFEKQFATKCARCHGKDAKGGGPNAAELEVPPANLTDASYMNTRTDEQLFQQILEGGKPPSPMPGFGPNSDQGWSEEKVREMVLYVRLLSKPDAQ